MKVFNQKFLESFQPKVSGKFSILPKRFWKLPTKSFWKVSNQKFLESFQPKVSGKFSILPKRFWKFPTNSKSFPQKVSGKFPTKSSRKDFHTSQKFLKVSNQ